MKDGTTVVPREIQVLKPTTKGSRNYPILTRYPFKGLGLGARTARGGAPPPGQTFSFTT